MIITVIRFLPPLQFWDELETNFHYFPDCAPLPQLLPLQGRGGSGENMFVCYYVCQIMFVCYYVLQILFVCYYVFQILFVCLSLT